MKLNKNTSQSSSDRNFSTMNNGKISYQPFECKSDVDDVALNETLLPVEMPLQGRKKS